MIVTSRARLLLLIAAAGALVGLVEHMPFLVQLGAATLIWIGFEWFVFRLRANSLCRRVLVKREVSDRQGSTRILWKGRPATVSLQLECRPMLRFLPATWATFQDLLPMGSSCSENSATSSTIALRGRQLGKIEYELQTNTVGAIRFFGVRCVLEDQHGFFQAERFLPFVQTMRVLPVSQKLGTATTIRKLRNAMPPPGIHTISKAGAGSELLEIRDYVPGDPPKSIAWKVSARRGTLMTKQFETEVPVRCQMFVDMSSPTRLGYPGPCLANRLVDVATAVSSLLISHRDAVGISVFDGHEVHLTKPSASRRANLQMMDMLATCIDKPLMPVAASVDSLLRPAFDLVRVRYPSALHYVQHASHRRLFPRSAKRRMREGLAAIISTHYRMGELSMGELASDDRRMSYWLQRFLSEHQVPYVGERFNENGQYLFADHSKIAQLSRLIAHAAARSRDSELFLVFAELCDVEYDLGPLISAMKLAIARQHRVAVLCAWPDRMPVADEPTPLGKLLAVSEPDMSWRLETRQRTSAFRRIRAELGRLRIPLAIASEEQALPLIAANLELVRAGRTVA